MPNRHGPLRFLTGPQVGREGLWIPADQGIEMLKYLVVVTELRKREGGGGGMLLLRLVNHDGYIWEKERLM